MGGLDGHPLDGVVAVDAVHELLPALSHQRVLGHHDGVVGLAHRDPDATHYHAAREAAWIGPWDDLVQPAGDLEPGQGLEADVDVGPGLELVEVAFGHVDTDLQLVQGYHPHHRAAQGHPLAHIGSLAHHHARERGPDDAAFQVQLQSVDLGVGLFQSTLPGGDRGDAFLTAVGVPDVDASDRVRRDDTEVAFLRREHREDVLADLAGHHALRA